MLDDEILDLVRRTPWLDGLLARCEFELARAAHGPVEPIRLAGGEPLEMIAGDGGGGAYLSVGTPGPVRPVVYASSEGRGGKIADSLSAALALVAGVPGHVSEATCHRLDDGGGELLAYLSRVEADEHDYWPEAADARARIRQALDLPPLDDAMLRALHAADADERYRPFSADGDRYDPLVRAATE